MLLFQSKKAEGEQEIRKVLAIMERVFGTDHPETLLTRVRLGQTLHRQGIHAEAETEFLKAAKGYEATLGPNHEDAINCRLTLASVFRAKGESERELDELRPVLALLEKSLGLDHPQTLSVMESVATCLYGLKRFPEAEREFQRLITNLEKSLGSDHEKIHRIRMVLISLLKDQAKFEGIIEDCKIQLAFEKRVFEPDSMFSFTTRRSLAEALLATGQNDEAEKQFWANLVQVESRSFQADPVALSARCDWARALNAKGRHSHAEEEFALVLSLLSAHYRKSADPDTMIKAQIGLADSLHGQKKFAAAETEYRAMLRVLENVPELYEPHGPLLCLNLSRTLKALNRKKEDLDFARHAAEGFSKSLGEEHPRTMEAKGRVEVLQKE